MHTHCDRDLNVKLITCFTGSGSICIMCSCINKCGVEVRLALLVVFGTRPVTLSTKFSKLNLVTPSSIPYYSYHWPYLPFTCFHVFLVCSHPQVGPNLSFEVQA